MMYHSSRQLLDFCCVDFATCVNLNVNMKPLRCHSKADVSFQTSVMYDTSGEVRTGMHPEDSGTLGIIPPGTYDTAHVTYITSAVAETGGALAQC